MTEITLKLVPLLAHRATLLAPFTTLEQVTEAVPRIIVERCRASHARVHRPDHDVGDHTGGRTRPRHLRRGPQSPTAAYLVVVLESRDPSAWTRTPEPSRTLLDKLGAIDVFVLPPTPESS